MANDKFIMRKLNDGDYDLCYLDVLSQLTMVGMVTKEMFIDFIKNQSKNCHIYVIHDVQSNRIVGTGTLLIENKIIHSCGKVGHIEDVVVDSTVRGMGFGKDLVEFLKTIAIEQKCYKIILDCNNDNIPFYEKCGFTKKETQMALYL